MSQRPLLPSEVALIEEAAREGSIASDLRLREGEYQYNLVKAIAAFQLGLTFPDVRDLIARLYGKDKSSDIQFVRKIQTILKKMEKSHIVRILPKKNPWQLQRYALPGFKFQDSDRNTVVLATDEQVKQMLEMLHSTLTQQKPSRVHFIRTLLIVTLATVSYAVAAWALLQPVISFTAFIAGLVSSVACSIALGNTLAKS